MQRHDTWVKGPSGLIKIGRIRKHFRFELLEVENVLHE